MNFFSHLEVQNVLKIHAKILSLNIFKKIQIFILPLAGVRQYHKIIQKSRPDPQELVSKFKSYKLASCKVAISLNRVR